MAKTKAAAAKKAVRKLAVKKSVVKKTAAKKTVAKKAAAKKIVQKAAAKKTASKKALVEKIASKKMVVKKAAPAPVKSPRKAPAVKTRPEAAPVPRDGCAPGSPWLIHTLTVRTAEAAIAFYQRAFGFTVDFTMPGPTGAIGYAQLRHQTALIHLSPEGAYGTSGKAPVTSGADCPAMAYVYCADVDALTTRAREAGAVILSEPATMFWGDRVMTLSDPEGYRWAFATNVGVFDASVMPPSDYPKHSI